MQKTARASHLQAKWPYPEDINLHLGQQQHEQQGDEMGYRQAHPAWLSIRTGSTRYFKVHLNTSFFSDGLIPVKVTILFTVFKLASAPLHSHRGHLQQQSTACTSSPSCPLTRKKVYEVKQANKMNVSRTCNTEQQAQQKTL